jgi:hypothetical protein
MPLTYHAPSYQNFISPALQTKHNTLQNYASNAVLYVFWEFHLMGYKEGQKNSMKN